MIFNILYAICIFVTSAMVTDFAHFARPAKGTTFYDTLIVSVVSTHDSLCSELKLPFCIVWKRDASGGGGEGGGGGRAGGFPIKAVRIGG